jgi:glycosyltransferase involved in cell wall biosynthesis
MIAKKAPVLTLDAFRRAARVMPDLHLDYIGDGELLPAAQQFISAFDLQDKVTLHGGQPADVVTQFLRKADVFLQHSIKDSQTGDEEGLPVIILEAMAQSLPVVSTLHSAIPEAVVDGRTGYLVEEGDSTGMSEHILDLARNADLRRQMGAAGWLRVKEHFSWQKGRLELLRILGLLK